MILGFLKQIFDNPNDPVKHCEVYKDKARGSCAHVDGILCDMPVCGIRESYLKLEAKIPLLEESGDEKEVWEYRHFEANEYVAEACRGWQSWKPINEQELKDIRYYITRGNKYQIRRLTESLVEGYAPPDVPQ